MKPQRWHVQEVSRSQYYLKCLHFTCQWEAIDITNVAQVDLSLCVAWVEKRIGVETRPVVWTEKREFLCTVQLCVKVVVTVIVAVSNHVRLAHPDVD